MKRTLAEKRVLKKLGITDFRHMTKEKVVKFASMLPYMDPGVAKKALEQFPAFKDLASDTVVELGNIVEKALNENATSQNAYYNVCNSIIASLQEELKQEALTSEDRDRIENKMIEVARMIGEKDSENKKFLVKLVTIVGFAGIAITAIAANILGSNTQISQPNDENDEDDYEENEDDEIDSDDIIEI